MEDRTEPRNKAEAILDVRYQIRFQALQAQYCKKVRAACTMLNLVFGSAAVVSAIHRPALISILGIAVATVSAAEFVFGWAERSVKHDACRRAAAELLEQSGDMSLEEIDRGLARLEREAENEVCSLRVVAYNDNVRSNGFPSYVLPEGMRQKLMRVFV